MRGGGPCAQLQSQEVAAAAAMRHAVAERNAIFQQASCPQRRRTVAAAAALPPPPLPPLPACRCASHSTRASSRHSVRTAAAWDDQGKQPAEQQPPAMPPQQEQQQQQPGSSKTAVSSTAAMLARSDQRVLAACRAALGLLHNLYRTVCEALALRKQLHYPSLGFVLRRTAQVLLVVAAFMAYVWVVDGACSHLPHAIEWTHAHPGWLRRAVGGLIATARQRLTGAA